ncbi:MAG TPA: DUF6602 domain-containing protein [Sedimentisphaerales bacterium]|nr:DUF6602 domain-containing protein [Sedimentisphaerales bacterium]
MNRVDYFRDLSKELRAVQNRIRNFIGEAHWPSDGAWKESVLRTVIRKYLPPSFTVGSGFVVTGEDVSTQIDILICDDSAPILFRDGDFLVATADCVRAVVEVKTKIEVSKVEAALKKLNGISDLMKRRCVHPAPFLGLFCYEEIACQPETILNELRKVNGEPTASYVIQALCFGDNEFYRFWEFNPQTASDMPYESWHAYKLEGTAPGYFIHNIIEFLFPRAVEGAENLWYPADGKESCLAGRKRRDNRRSSL